jgi:Holliday junction resolvase RusA-like endonuclease
VLAPGDAIIIEVVGRPATFATAHEQPWKAAIREAVAAAGITPQVARWAVRVEFRTPPPRHSGEKWDLDNLVKPTLDAMEGVFGLREWRGVAQPADDRVDYIEATKRTVGDGEQTGATIVVWPL